MISLILALSVSVASPLDRIETPHLESLWFWAHSGCISQQHLQFKPYCEIQNDIEVILRERQAR